MSRFLVLLILLIKVGCIYAEKIRTVEGCYTYYAPETLSIDEARRIAIDRAKINAIADEFGTVIAQSNSTIMSNKNGESDTHFYSMGESDVKGVWISDIKEPSVTFAYDNNMLVVTAKVIGKAREQSRADYELSIQTLCNGIESENNRFRNKDRFAVRLCSPVNGYFSIWLADDDEKQVYCLLPYENGSGIAKEIKSRKEYVLLSTADTEYPYNEETILTSENDLEINRLIFIFSTSRFTMPATEQGEFVPEISLAKFDKWLQKNRIKDDNMFVSQKIIEIKK